MTSPKLDTSNKVQYSIYNKNLIVGMTSRKSSEYSKRGGFATPKTSLPKSSLTFTRGLINQWINKCTKQNYDIPVIVYGREGVGKSSLAILLAHVIMERQGRQFNIQRNIHFTVQSFHKAVFSSHPGDVQIIDEAILFAFSRKSLSKENTELVKILATCRSQCNIIFFCIPSFHSVDKYLREHRIVCGLEVTRRGGFTIWPKKAMVKMANRKPHGMKNIIRDYFPSIQNALNTSVWNHYESHKAKQVKRETIGEKAAKVKVRWVTGKQLMATYKIGPTLLRNLRAKRAVEFARLPTGHYRYNATDMEAIMGLD